MRWTRRGVSSAIHRAVGSTRSGRGYARLVLLLIVLAGTRAPAAPRASLSAASDGKLEPETPEANPYSADVTLRLTVTPALKAVVMWGGKTLAQLAPGRMEADIVRPRGSGPLDLEIRADGYLPYHTRLYTDRDNRDGNADKVTVRMYRDEDACGLLGYRRGGTPGGMMK